MPKRRYENTDPSHRPHGPAAIFRWGVTDRLLRRRRRCPAGPPAPTVDVDLDAISEPGEYPRLTWIGHASFLGSMGGRHFLVDPVFSGRAGVFYPRFGAPGLQPSDLPPITAVMVTHGRWCRRRNCRRVIELQWWESVEVDGLEITLVPARHWSRRGILDTNRALWGGFVVGKGSARIYHSGDTAWFEGFREIGQHFPGLLAALLPIGGYDPGWFMEPHHLTPEQAGRAFLELGARHFVPMHWGTFRLTDEPLCEPAERVREWWDRHQPGDGRRMRMMAIGETVELE